MPTNIEKLKGALIGYLGSAIGSGARDTVADLVKDTHTILVQDAATAGTAITETVVVHVQGARRFKLGSVAAPIAVAADNTDYVTFTLAKRTAAGAAVTLASGDTRAASLNALAAFIPEALVNTTTAADLELADGDVVTFKAVKSGSGKALVAATSYMNVTVELEMI